MKILKNKINKIKNILCVPSPIPQSLLHTSSPQIPDFGLDFPGIQTEKEGEKDTQIQDFTFLHPKDATQVPNVSFFLSAVEARELGCQLSLGLQRHRQVEEVEIDDSGEDSGGARLVVGID